MNSVEEEQILTNAAAILQARKDAAAEPAADKPVYMYPGEEAEFAAAYERMVALNAEQNRRDEADRKQKIKDLQALARLKSPPDPAPVHQNREGWTMLGGPSPSIVCWECRQAVWGTYVLAGIHMLCTPCSARHQLRCAQCGRHGDLTTRFCSDYAWRCDTCITDIQPVPAARKMRSALVVRR